MLPAGLSDPRAFLGKDAISYSEISVLANCEMKWTLMYNTEERGEKQSSAAMDLGKEMHTMLGRWWTDKPTYVSEFETANWLMERYDRHYGSLTSTLHMLELELPFAVRLWPTGPYIFGWFDGLVYDSATGKYWIAEFKTMGNWEKLNQIPVDKQISIYIWAAREMGFHVEGVMYDAIKTYQWKKDDRPTFESFERLFVTRTPEQLFQVYAEMVSATELKKTLSSCDRDPLRNVGQGCSWCPVLPECFGTTLDIQPESDTLDF